MNFYLAATFVDNNPPGLDGGRKGDKTAPYFFGEGSPPGFRESSPPVVDRAGADQKARRAAITFPLVKLARLFVNR